MILLLWEGEGPGERAGGGEEESRSYGLSEV